MYLHQMRFSSTKYLSVTLYFKLERLKIIVYVRAIAKTLYDKCKENSSNCKNGNHEYINEKLRKTILLGNYSGGKTLCQ